MLCDLTFVNHVGNPALINQKEDDMPTIRSHAMREVQRRRKLARQTSGRWEVDERSPTEVKNSNWRRMPLRSTPSIKISHSMTQLNETPIELEHLVPNVLQHLHYFVHGFTPSTFPTTHIRHKCDILPIAFSLKDPMLLHALCAISTMHQTLTYGSGILSISSVVPEHYDTVNSSFLYHKQRAISSLRTSLLAGSGSRNPSIQATIILLLTVEILRGDQVTASAHKSGLLELVKYGEWTRKSPHLMLSDAMMSDLKSSASSLSQPSVLPDGNWVNELDKLKCQPFEPHRPDLASLGSGFMTLDTRNSLGSYFVRLMRAMQHLINAVEQSYDLGIGVSQIDGTHFLVLEHQLLSFQSYRRGVSSLNSKLTECCRLAALLYCNLCLWSWPKTSTLIKNLSGHFHQAMEALLSELQVGEQLPIMLWLYFIGSLATSSTDELKWYLKGTMRVYSVLGVEDEVHFRSILANFLYVDRLLGEHLYKCYREVLRGLGGG